MSDKQRTKAEAMEEALRDLINLTHDRYEFDGEKLPQARTNALAARDMPDDDPWLDPEEPPKKVKGCSCERVWMELEWNNDPSATVCRKGFFYEKEWRFGFGGQSVIAVGWICTGYQHLPKPRGEKKEKGEDNYE